MKRYEIITVREYKKSDGSTGKNYLKIGAAFPMRERDGFSIILDAIPIGGAEANRLMMLLPDENRIPKGDHRSKKDDDDDVPF